MMEFMFIAAPRSGTAWAANWMTTGNRLCLHDPLWQTHFDDLDTLAYGFQDHCVGLACTGLGYWPEWLNAHPAPKVILHREPAQVNASLAKIGLPECPSVLFRNLELIDGLHVYWTELFDNPQLIHDHLFIADKLQVERHRLLRDMVVTAKWQDKKQNPDVWMRLKEHVHASSDPKP
jgi:hypothetical protein